MNVLVWQWGRRGGGPRIAVELAEAMNRLPGVHGQLSLSDRAEILSDPSPPVCAMRVATYDGMAGFGCKLLQSPVIIARLYARLRELRSDLAVCAMPGPLDLLLVAALRLRRIPLVVIVHDADPHPGDVLPVMVKIQRLIVRRADALVTLSAHVADRLRDQGVVRGGLPLAVLPHPPRDFGPRPLPPFAHGGPLRLLFFGRLLPYKGLDLLAEALSALGPRADLQTRIVGSGPETEVLATLRTLPGVTVENRWVPEYEIGDLIAWSDALVLPYREASQSGAAAAAIAACRHIVATRVGGLIEQVEGRSFARLCDPDPASLAAAIDSLALSRGAGCEGLSHPQPSELSWPDFARSVIDLAGRVASGS